MPLKTLEFPKKKQVFRERIGNHGVYSPGFKRLKIVTGKEKNYINYS